MMSYIKTLSRSTFESVQPKKELQQLIKDAVKKEGNEADLNFIDTSLITDMSYLFIDMSNFNGKIDKWDVSKVVDMDSMFKGAERSNQSIDNWDTSNVIDMKYMFDGTKSFNQSIDKWDVSKVTSMISMFDNTKLEKSGNLPDWFNKK